ncbi:MAG: hypothetical protein JNL38_04985, partial [Myxococcales bacterium]|nr:hypothetical protein [Myxococcales bacterium]
MKRGAAVATAALALTLGALLGGDARADAVLVDRAAARWSTPETGGPPRPRFVTAR